MNDKFQNRSTVTGLTTGQYSASTLYANWYEPNWSLSSLVDGDAAAVAGIP